jgi:hypothetical protein
MTLKKNSTTFRHALALVAPFVLGAALMPIGCSAWSRGRGRGRERRHVRHELRRVQGHRVPGAGYGHLIVDGDTPVADERALRDFYSKHIQQGALAIATSGGVDVKWSDAQKTTSPTA